MAPAVSCARLCRAHAIPAAGAIAPAGAIAAAGPDFEAAGPDFKAAGPDFEAARPDFGIGQIHGFKWSTGRGREAQQVLSIRGN